MTYVSCYGLEEARRLAEASSARARKLLAVLPGDTSALAALTAYIGRRRR